MLVDPKQLRPTDLYRLLIGAIVPRPIGWISTVSARGIANLAPFSYFNGCGVSPPAVCFTPINDRHGNKKDTIRNLNAVPEFVVNVVTGALADAMNRTSATLDYEESEFERAGVAPAPSTRVRPPGVRDSPIRMECKLFKIVEIGDGPLSGNLVIGTIELIHLDDAVLGDNGLIDARKLDLIGRMGGDLYARTTDLFELHRPS